MELSLILSYLRPYRLHLVGALLSVALFTLVQLVVPWYAGSSVNEIIRTRSIGVLDRTGPVGRPSLPVSSAGPWTASPPGRPATPSAGRSWTRSCCRPTC